MIWGSGGSKSRLTKAAGAEPAGQIRDEKLHAVVARSTFASQNVQNTWCSEHFWKLRCRKSARRCGAKHISKSKVQKSEGYGALLDVQMWLRVGPGGPMAGLRGSAPLPQTRWALTSMHYDHKKKEYQRPSHIPRFFPNLMFFLLLTLLSPAFLLLLLALLALAPGPSCSPFLLCAAWRPSLKPFSCQGSKKAASPHSNSMAVKDGTGPRATAFTG